MIFRSSMLSTFKSCPAKCCYKYELGLVPYGVKRKKNDLEFGSLVHNGIERYHLSGDDLGAALEFMENEDIPETRRKNKTTAQALVKKYAATNEVKMIEVEKLFQYPIGDHTWMGQFDGIGEWNGELWVIEHKTTNPEYLQFKPNDQFIAYYIGANILYGNEVKGVLIDNLNCDKLDVKRTPVTFNKDETEEWKDEMAATAEVYMTYKKLGIFPKNAGGCMAYNSKCTFMPLCTEPEGSRGIIQERCYVVNENYKKLQW